MNDMERIARYITMHDDEYVDCSAFSFATLMDDFMRPLFGLLQSQQNEIDELRKTQAMLLATTSIRLAKGE